jgi:hypothetical protein
VETRRRALKHAPRQVRVRQLRFKDERVRRGHDEAQGAVRGGYRRDAGGQEQKEQERKGQGEGKVNRRQKRGGGKEGRAVGGRRGGHGRGPSLPSCRLQTVMVCVAYPRLAQGSPFFTPLLLRSSSVV